MVLQHTTVLHVALSLPWYRQSDVHSQQRFFCQMQTAEVTVDQALNPKPEAGPEL